MPSVLNPPLSIQKSYRMQASPAANFPDNRVCKRQKGPSYATQCLSATLISNAGKFCYCVIFHKYGCSFTADTYEPVVGYKHNQTHRKVKFTPQPTMKPQKGTTGTVLIFLEPEC